MCMLQPLCLNFTLMIYCCAWSALVEGGEGSYRPKRLKNYQIIEKDNLFDFWADASLHLLLLKSSMWCASSICRAEKWFFKNLLWSSLLSICPCFVYLSMDSINLVLMLTVHKVIVHKVLVHKVIVHKVHILDPKILYYHTSNTYR